MSEQAENGNEKGKVGYGKPPVEHQFQPGWQGGPGRPQGSVSIVAHLKKLLEANEQERAEELGLSLIKNAINGNGTAIKEIMSRIDGPIVQKLEVDDVSGLTDEERAARTLTILDRARARRAGQADGNSDAS